jgi:hypothetical protein
MKYWVSLIGAFALFSSAAIFAAAPQTAAPLRGRSYTWYGQLISVDEQTRTATVKAHIPPHVEKYVDRFKAGDRLVLVGESASARQMRSTFRACACSSESSAESK